jgi:hypothetical protein
MLFCQLGRAQSLREICGGLAASEGKLKHLGLPRAPSRSTLSYANEHRPWQLYETIFHQLLEKCQGAAASQPGKKKRKFRFKNRLLSLDASVISLCASVFDWAQYRRRKGAVKLHLLLDHDGYLPSFAVVTEGKTSEIKVARTLRFEPGTILAIDRGYIDYDWFRELTQEEVYFVTRMKEKAVYEIKEELEVPQNRNVVRDQIICFPRLAREGEEQVLFRRVEIWDKEKEEAIVFLSNLLAFGATTIAAIYNFLSGMHVIASYPAPGGPYAAQKRATNVLRSLPNATSPSSFPPGVDTLVNFTGQFKAEGVYLDGTARDIWQYSMVGRPPSHNGTTSINAPVIPVTIDMLSADGTPRSVVTNSTNCPKCKPSELGQTVRLISTPTAFVKRFLNGPVYGLSTYTSSPVPKSRMPSNGQSSQAKRNRTGIRYCCPALRRALPWL